ncbi:MAG: calcium/proton exchanger [Thermomicrobiales bacterium]
MPRWLYGFLIFGAGALIADLAGAPELMVFILAALGIIPVSGLIGRATEDLAHRVGPKFGGLLNATFGNAAEMIIGIVAINAGLLDLVKASVTGSIIGNLLLVLGMGFLWGGLRHGTLKFDREEAGRNSVMMILALGGLVLPAAFAIADPDTGDIGNVSVAVSIVLIVLYVAYIGYSFTSQGSKQLQNELEPPSEHPANIWSTRLALAVLIGATLATVVLAELLVGTIEHVSEDFHLNEFVVGIILIPIIGNVAEHFSAVLFAARNKPDIAQAIAAGSSTQVALLVGPAFVLISYALGNPMNLVFTPLEIVVVGLSAFVFAFISLDGESNWLEAVELLGLYVMAALVFFFLPV